MRRFLPLIFIAFGLFTLWQADSVLAACWCANGSDDGCRCDRRGTDGFGPVDVGGIEVYCETEAETRAHDATRSPICGSSAEIVPWCAYSANPRNTTFWTCYGGSFASGESNIVPYPRNQGEVSTGDIDGAILWNGVQFGVGNPQNHYFACANNLFCCGNTHCSNDGVPQTLSNCEPQNQSITPPVNICGIVDIGDFQGEGESRLWFSQTRLIATLASAAQTLFNPFDLERNPDAGNYNRASFSKNTPLSDTGGSVTNQGGLSSRVERHQGVNDMTQIVNQRDTDGRLINNSSVIIGAHAPPSLETTGPGEALYNNPACYIPESEVENRAGDDLVGPRIVSELLYTGEFTYTPLARAPGCTRDGDSFIRGAGESCSQCCSLDCSPSSNQCAVYDPLGECMEQLPGDQERVVCTTIPDEEIETEGNIQIFDKTPLIEHIYNVLLAGSDSLYRRFMPQTEEEFEEIPTSTGFRADVSLASPGAVGAVEVEFAEGQADTPRLYVPRVGTLDRYWLEEFQTSIRPQGYGRRPGPAEPLTAPDGNAIVCSYSQEQVDNAIATVEDKYGIPEGLLQAILDLEGAKWKAHPNNYICIEDGDGAAGIMQVIRQPEAGVDTYTYTTCSSERMSEEEEFSSCTSPTGKLSRCDVDDAFELAARTLLWNANMWHAPSCSVEENSVFPTDTEGVYTAACNYYGSFDNIDWPNGYLEQLPNPLRDTCDPENPDRNLCMNYCDVVCNKMGRCPPYPNL